MAKRLRIKPEKRLLMQFLVVHVTLLITAQFQSYKLPENLINYLSMTQFIDCEVL
jgi:hypothetical protein